MSMDATHPDWVAVDWGTTHVRVWLMSHDGQVLDHRHSDQGMGRLDQDQFEPVLTDLLAGVAPSPTLPVLICGMAGSRQGWTEAPYVTTPCAPPGIDQATRAPCKTWDVRILPGVKQASPADVMRGEETQIAGVLLEEPTFEGVLCLPGTHNKWARIEQGRITAFQTFMTGELFALLEGQSVLRHSVATRGWDADAFDIGVSQGLDQPHALAGALFSLRAESLLNDLSGTAARARLSGLLIGAELAATRALWRDHKIAVLGGNDVAHSYEAALAAQGAVLHTLDLDNPTLSGLRAAYAHLKETT
ncbi:2-dehydro-3-deoxygalactonokinase [Tropicibacter sp. R16_0]|uniref:2-dehydro-3-deoxygalactonokinase n=1 Tax=Tropicibacter sp. R16_0 TaxID=2821102 RepID=UPI003369EF70